MARAFIIIFAAFAFSHSGCKKVKNSSTTKASQCTWDKLGQLEEELRMTMYNEDGASLSLSGTDPNILVGRYTGNFQYRATTPKAYRIAYEAPYSGWETDLAVVCSLYSSEKAVEVCKTNWTCGYWGIDRNSPSYQTYRQAAITDCLGAFQGHVSSKGPLRPSGSTNSPNSTSGTPHGQGDVSSSGQPQANGSQPSPSWTPTNSNENSGQTAAQKRERRIQELNTQIVQCKATLERQTTSGKDINLEDAFRKDCRLASGDTLMENPLTCFCPSGAQVVFDGKSTEACPSEQVASHPSTPGGIAQPSTQQPMATATAVAPPASASCECKLQNGTCVKLVNGRVVASKTPFFNSQIQQQEKCDPSRAGGYENLCNQPDMRCP